MLTALALAGLLAACSSAPASPSGGSGSPGTNPAGTSPAPTETGAAAAENGGGEAPATRFVSSRNHYRVDAPGAMTEGSDGIAKASHGLESLQIEVLTGSAAADVSAYAKSDLTTLRSTPGFSLKSGPGSVSLSAASSAQKTVYTANGPNNPVTGKPQTFVTVRYYVPRSSSTMAVLTYSIVLDQYDPQGADDVANTFAWT
ncbi:MAG TPA: hypothetical protein VGQ42_09675 [Candidatus Dormibacteraeota bacterium]|jgi:hypothetical protein|nr:hypothetical protein [Candidatus Dormibacteraeota bacterium]